MTSRKHRVLVSDHAVLRYLERVGGFDIESLRRQIADRLEAVARAGAESVVIDGYRYVLRSDSGGPVVTTVLEKGWMPSDHHHREEAKAQRAGGGK